MLVLTRRIGEVIVIDGDIEVTVLDVRGRQVKYGVSAPADVSINRKEIQDKIDAEQELKEASGG